jgi:hypothetical protein
MGFGRKTVKDVCLILGGGQRSNRNRRLLRLLLEADVVLSERQGVPLRTIQRRNRPISVFKGVNYLRI